MRNYSYIAIIYNPNSTGSSELYARDLHSKLVKKLPAESVKLIATKYAGHAKKLAYSISKKHKFPLIISSSGDGGYNEVINGALNAQLEGAHPTTGLLPAGNANDHHRNLARESFIERVIKAESQDIDVLIIEGDVRGKHTRIYAHSYIGFGLTPIVGAQLNKTNLNWFTEILVVAKSFIKFHPISLQIKGVTKKYDSIVFSSIDSMSKYLQISTPSSVTDGKFEVTMFIHRGKLALLLTLLKSMVKNSQENTSESNYELTTISPTLVQVDGEIITIDANSIITISIKQQILRSIV